MFISRVERGNLLVFLIFGLEETIEMFSGYISNPYAGFLTSFSVTERSISPITAILCLPINISKAFSLNGIKELAC